MARGYAELDAFDRSVRVQSRDILEQCARDGKPAILVLARPYHTDRQARGYPVVWGHYLPLDADPLDWLFGAEVASGEIRSALDTQDGWRSSYNGNANEILWSAKFAARCPWITCMIRLTSDECGMD